MLYKDIENLKPTLFKRLTGVKKEVFLQMLYCITTFKQHNRKHATRGKPPILSYADKLLLMLMYYREYCSQFHIGITYGIAESSVREVGNGTYSHSGQTISFAWKKKALLENTFEVVLVDVTESPVERPKKNSEAITQTKRNATRKKHN